MTLVLGIETSCDETSVALVTDDRKVLANLVATQFDLHAKYGGVVPEIASRAHIECLDPLVEEALRVAGCTPDNIDAIAVTAGPGLIGCLIVGVTAAKTLAWAWGKPLVGVNHIQAHACSAALALDHDPWPAVALVVSGGHTSLFHVTGYDKVRPLGSTIDDAAGEAFDKVASILQLGFPGGPIVDRRAATGNASAIQFPRTTLKDAELDFSFSGLKTAVLYHVHGPGKTSGGLEKLTPAGIDDICASFSAAVVDVLVQRTVLAAGQTKSGTIVVGGGVAANSMLRSRLSTECAKHGLALHLTPMKFCTDNAAMIAFLGAQLFLNGRSDDLSLTAQASMPIGPA
jgi:N6-L-threonylcarbamoyladenine synthase